MFKGLILLFSLVLSGCSTLPVQPSKSDSVPASAYQSANPDELTVALVGINDFHGSLLPRERKWASSKGEGVIYSGGASALASMLSILKKEMKGRVLLVDAGDEWQGTLESNLVHGASVVEFFNRIGMNVAAIGNHEFDFNLANMQNRFREAHYPYVAANIFLKKTGKRPAWKNVYPSRIFEVEGIKIGVIGHSTIYTPGTTRYEFVKHLDFKDSSRIVSEESRKLKAQGAKAVLLTAHAGTLCQRKGLNEWKLLTLESEQGDCELDEISKLASQVDSGSLDGIVAGHTHQVIHHWIYGIPVIQDEAYNQHFNIIYLTFNRKTGSLVHNQTRIEGLVPICTQFFEGRNHCDVRRLAAGEFPRLVPAMFHGEPVVEDGQIRKWLDPIEKSTQHYRTEVIATAELPLHHYRDREGAFGNLVADALRERAGTDFSMVNSGGIRTALDAGPITFDGIFRALPFDNLLNVVRLKGKDVKLMYRVAISGSHGIVGFSGLKITLVPYDQKVASEDLNGDGKQEAWEVNRMLKIETSDGKELEDEKTYSIATYDFLVNGGDDLIWFMQRVPESNISRKYSDYCRDIVAAYLRKRKVINTSDHPLVDPKNPRVIFQRQ